MRYYLVSSDSILGTVYPIIMSLNSLKNRLFVEITKLHI